MQAVKLEEDIGEQLYRLGYTMTFQIKNGTSMKERIENLNFIKLNASALQKSQKRMRWEATNQSKKFAKKNISEK